jgi:transglutaminase-like putative cysteine protease
VDARGIDLHHDYSPWSTRVTFADISVDLQNDAYARRFVRETVRRIDRSQPELKQIARAISLIRERLRYDRDYQVVVPQGEGPPRPVGFYLQQGRGVCRQFAVALKLVSDGLGIKCRLERGTIGKTVLPLPLRRKLKDQLDVRLCTRLMELGSLCQGSAERGGFHIYNEIQLKDGTCYTADPTGKTLAPTTRATATGMLRPISDVPWYSYLSVSSRR